MSIYDSAPRYSGIFKSRYALKGRDWVRKISKEDLAVFVDMGLKAHNHGKMGGDAVVKKHGKDHMKSIGRIGAIVTNSWKFWNKAIQEEIAKELGTYFDM